MVQMHDHSAPRRLMRHALIPVSYHHMLKQLAGWPTTRWPDYTSGLILADWLAELILGLAHPDPCKYEHLNHGEKPVATQHSLHNW